MTYTIQNLIGHKLPLIKTNVDIMLADNLNSLFTKSCITSGTQNSFVPSSFNKITMLITKYVETILKSQPLVHSSAHAPSSPTHQSALQLCSAVDCFQRSAA